jgi:uncharacterized Fe-S radical SAM superfamily protein PflX
MFYNCRNLEKPICQNWDISQLKYADRMFEECKKFDADCLKHWDLKKLSSCHLIFWGVLYKKIDLIKID